MKVALHKDKKRQGQPPCLFIADTDFADEQKRREHSRLFYTLKSCHTEALAEVSTKKRKADY